MTSPYLQLHLRSWDEALEEKSLKELRLRHKRNQIANGKSSVAGTENVYRLGPRLITKLGAKS